VTEPQQPAAPLEVDDPEPAPPEPNPTLEAPPAPEPQASDPRPAFVAPEAPEVSEAFEDVGVPEALQAIDEEHADEAPQSVETEATEGNDGSVPADDEPRLAEEPAFEPEPAAVEEPAVPRTAGHFVAEALRAAGVRYAFTVPGESFLGVLEALGDVGIRVVATRHEGAAAFMAEAYGQLTGRPAACLGTRAVGAANLAIGIHTALQDSTPMFAIVGQVERTYRGREAFQEVDQTESFGRLAKWSAEPRSVDELASVLPEAVQQALGGRPGPVLLSLPEDLLDETVPGETRIELSRPPTARPTDDDVRAVLRLLANAERPLILAGAGVLRARTSTDLTRFAELLRVPVVASWRRGDVISNENPLYLGMAGLGAPDVVRERIEAADALLVLGCRLSETTTFGYRVPAAGSRWAHVDIDPRVPPGQPGPTFSITSDARAFLRASIDRLLNQAVLDVASVDERHARNEADRAAWEAATVVDDGPWDGPGVHPGRTIATLRRVLPDDAIVTSDAGNFAGWLNRGFRFRKPGTFLGPTSGAMGYGLPAAIAAALVHRDRPAVALVGDGGLGMTLAELETAVRERARVIVVVFDNQRYGTIRMWQERRGSGQGVATELGPVDFAAIARACGARGVLVERDDEFEPALRQALVAERPSVIQVVLDQAWISVGDRPER
jgi:acetolactate synthase-1/2/3 large subunit